ncbi:MAG: ComEA family DNA-binding protein [Dehalococcoidia bacterium]
MAQFLEQWRWYIVALLALPMVFALGVLLSDELDGPLPLVIESRDLPTADVRVYITGAVVNPGVYPLAENTRWINALDAAGGPTEAADLTAINLSRRIVDEDHIIVPAIGGTTAVAGASQSPLVNINAAGQAELEGLPGIGEVRAQSIIQSRTVDGPFGAIEDLLSRDIVPDSVFEDIAPLISVY